MNKKILINEIYRQLELMGVDRKILNENKFVNMGSDLIRSFIAKTQIPIKDDVINVLVGSIKVSKSFVDEMINILDNPSRFNLLSYAEKRLFGQIIAQDSEVVNAIYKDIIKDFMAASKKTEKSLIQYFAKQIEGGRKTISQVITELNGNVEDVFLNSIIGGKISKRIGELSNFTPEVKNVNKFVDPTTGLSWASPEVLEMSKQLTKVQKIFKTAGKYSGVKALKNALKNYEPFWAQYIRNWYSNIFFTWGEVQKKNILKAKEFIQNAYKLEEQGKHGDAVRELQKSLSQILIAKKEPGYNVTDIIKSFITENPNLETETIQMFENSTAAGNNTIKEFITSIADDTHNELVKPLKSEAKSYAELIPGVGSLMKKDLNAVNSVKEAITTPIIRWFNLLTWKDPRGAYDVILAMSKRGVKKEVTSRLMSFFLFHVVIIPGVISAFKTYGDQFNASTRLTYLQALKRLCDEGLLTEGCSEIETELNSIKFIFAEDYVKNALAAMPIDLGKMFGGTSWDEAEQKLNENKYFFTYWDDVVNQIWNIVQGSPFPFVGEPKANKILNILENTSKKVSQELQKLGINPNSEDLKKEIEDFYLRNTTNEERKRAQEVIDKAKTAADSARNNVPNPPISTEKIIDNSEQGFKNWCEKTSTIEKPRRYKSWDEPNGFGYTEDGLDWEFIDGTFVEA